jgi:hypothetical protein
MASGEAGAIRVVPKTDLDALGLVDGDARNAKDEPCRVGQGGDALFASGDGGWTSSLERLLMVYLVVSFLQLPSEHHLQPSLHELSLHTSASGGENGVSLLKSQEDEEGARTAEEADGLSGIPLLGYTAEGHRYDPGDE